MIRYEMRSNALSSVKQGFQQTSLISRPFNGFFYFNQLVGGLGHNLKISNKVLEIEDQVEITT